MAERQVKRCANCGKAFSTRDGRARCCSRLCDEGLRRMTASDLARAVRVADVRFEPLTDCEAYDKRSENCVGLDGLYCTVEKCKFYRKRGERGNENRR